MEPGGEALHVRPDERSGVLSAWSALASCAGGALMASCTVAPASIGAAPASATSIGSLPTEPLLDEEEPLLDDDPLLLPDDELLDDDPPLLLDDELQGRKLCS